MPRLDVQIPAPDGRGHGTLHVPDGDGPWPGVLVFPDAGGARETFGQMGDGLAGLGYVVLTPDIYLRSGEWAPFDVATLFTDPAERARMSGLVRPLTNDAIIADAGAYAEFLLARPEVSGSAIGTTGYCLGGRMSLIAAGGLGRTIAAAASFPGGRGAVADDPPSPAPASSTPWSSTRLATGSRCPTTRPTTLRRSPGTGGRSSGCTATTSGAERSAGTAPGVDG